MKFDILTLFPPMFDGPLTESIIRRAVERGLVNISLHNIRDYATDRHRVVDDAPYGGGDGMVMKVEPLAACIEAVKAGRPAARVILTTPGDGDSTMTPPASWPAAKSSSSFAAVMKE